jgi:hypothetical protein
MLHRSGRTPITPHRQAEQGRRQIKQGAIACTSCHSCRPGRRRLARGHLIRKPFYFSDHAHGDGYPILWVELA